MEYAVGKEGEEADDIQDNEHEHRDDFLLHVFCINDVDAEVVEADELSSC